MPTDTIEDRLRYLESSVEVQEKLITSLHAERIEAERLHESVEQLGLNAGILGEALQQVDRNAQLLSQLGQELQRVEGSAVSKTDLAKAAEEQAATVAAAKKQQDEEALQFRKKALQRIYTTAMVLTSLFVVGVLVFVGQQSGRRAASKEVCESRNEQIEVIIDVLQKAATAPDRDPSQTSPFQVDIDRFKALQANCEQL